ncbi:MAG: hypothetical protein HHJ15_08730 [Rhodoferax sp.]|nr:hypothetical protein [Rhodoferax sp.]
MLLTAVALGFATQFTGCASTTPELDAKFGDAVRAARESQTLNPTASTNKDPVLGLDGKAAVNALERYQDSFKSPPKTFEVINITGGQ